MQVQKISTITYNKNNSIKKTNYQKAPAFKGYKEVLENVVKRDLKDVNDVSSAFGDLCRALKSSPGVKISPELALLEENGFKQIHTFMEKICAPIAKVPSLLRDIVFKTENDNIILLEKDNVGSLMMCNFGKRGFLNSIFNSQDAKNDIKFLFSSPDTDCFEISLTKEGRLHVEQIDFPHWRHSEYGIFSRFKEKSGFYDATTEIW